LQWEQANLPWELPTYIGDFAWDLLDMKGWITISGFSEPTTVEPTVTTPTTIPRALAESEG